MLPIKNLQPMKLTRLLMLLCSAALFITVSSCKKKDTTPAFALVAPPAASSNITNTQVFSCTAVTNVLTYVFVFTAGSGPQITQTTTQNNCTVSNLLPGVTYTWHVLATLQDGSVQTSPTWSFMVAGNNNGIVPTLQQPSAGAADVCTSPTFSWSAVTGATTYDLTISTDAGFLYITKITTVSGTSYALPAAILTPGHILYYWRVSATGSGVNSATGSFTTVGLATTLTPANGATQVSLTPTSTWAAVPCATTYSLELSNYADFSPVLASQVVTGTTFTIPAGTPLSSGRTYYWHVKRSEDTVYSATSSFTTQ